MGWNRAGPGQIVASEQVTWKTTENQFPPGCKNISLPQIRVRFNTKNVTTTTGKNLQHFLLVNVHVAQVGANLQAHTQGMV